MKKINLSVILPTYNEIDNIVTLLHAVIGYLRDEKITFEIIVVDDSSPDGTAKKAQGVADINSKIKVYSRKKMPGLANSILFGVRKAKGDFVLVMDTDFNHDPQVIPTMYQLAITTDLVIGSRYIANGGMENRVRHWLSYLFNLYLRILLSSPIHDHLSGFFIIKRKHLLSHEALSVFYGFGDYFIRLIYLVQQKRLKIKETPVFYKNRTFGVSKSRFISMFIAYTKTALKLRLIRV